MSAAPERDGPFREVRGFMLSLASCDAWRVSGAACIAVQRPALSLAAVARPWVVGERGGRVRGGSRCVRTPARPTARFRDFEGRHTDHVDTVIDRSPLAPRAWCSRLPEWPERNLWRHNDLRKGPQ